MIDIFYKGSVQNNLRIPYAWNALEPLVKTKLEIIEDYYGRLDRKVDNSNLLVRIINNFNVNPEREFLEYLSIVDRGLPTTLRNFNIVNLLNEGSVVRNVFGNNEVILRALVKLRKDYTSYMDSPVAYTKALKVISYSGVDLSMVHPDDLINDGVTIIEIDLTLLMLKYREWALDRIAKDRDIDPAYFIYSVVQVELIRDMFNFSVLNRFFTMERGNKPTTIEIAHKVSTMNLSARINNILKEVVRISRKIKSSPLQRLELLPLIDTTGLELLQYTKETNIQSEWVNLLARVNYYYLIVSQSDERSTRADKLILTRMNRYLIEIENNHIISKAVLRNYRSILELDILLTKELIEERL